MRNKKCYAACRFHANTKRLDCIHKDMTKCKAVTFELYTKLFFKEGSTEGEYTHDNLLRSVA